MKTGPQSLTHVTIAAVVGGLLMLPSTEAQAQPPRQMGSQITRARQACDVAAAQAGYRVMRRDRENVNGNSYQLPMHVSHGSTESDITCSYDYQRGVASVPPWATRENTSNGRYDRDDRNRRGGNYTDRAQRVCENYINQRRGWRAVQVGTPTQHGQRQWDVPVTVDRNGRGQQTVTCRYNTANGKVSIH
jgi:hypothetical protein